MKTDENLPEYTTPMKSGDFSGAGCRHCANYQPEGRRGGHCQQLGVSVRGSWKACQLYFPPFAPSWESLKENGIYPDEIESEKPLVLV